MLFFNQYTTVATEPVIDADTPLDSLDSITVLYNILARTLDKRKPVSTQVEGFFQWLTRKPSFFHELTRSCRGWYLPRDASYHASDTHIFTGSFSTDGGRQIQRHNSFNLNTCFLTAPKGIQEKNVLFMLRVRFCPEGNLNSKILV